MNQLISLSRINKKLIICRISAFLASYSIRIGSCYHLLGDDLI
jgi:hypothetical protein